MDRLFGRDTVSNGTAINGTLFEVVLVSHDILMKANGSSLVTSGLLQCLRLVVRTFAMV